MPFIIYLSWIINIYHIYIHFEKQTYPFIIFLLYIHHGFDDFTHEKYGGSFHSDSQTFTVPEGTCVMIEPTNAKGGGFTQKYGTEMDVWNPEMDVCDDHMTVL